MVNKQESPEGNALRALREIRVRAEPSWDAPEVQLMFWFIRHEQQNQFEGIGWAQFLKQWLKLIPEAGRFYSVEGSVVPLEDMTAKDYVESDPLDLDHLSSQKTEFIVQLSAIQSPRSSDESSCSRDFSRQVS